MVMDTPYTNDNIDVYRRAPILEYMDSQVYIDQSVDGVMFCIDNAERFVVAADTLYSVGHYRESYLLALYASEELGKVVLIVNYPIHARLEDTRAKWATRFHDHTEKFWFFRNLEELQEKIVSTAKGPIDELRKRQRLQVSYVDYTRDGFQEPTIVTPEDARLFLDATRQRLAEMKERHSSRETLREQIARVANMEPKSLSEMKAELVANGFREDTT